jgi:hypothetical protein
MESKAAASARFARGERMNGREFVHLGSLRDVAHFQEQLVSLHLAIPCDRELACGADSPLAQPLVRHGIRIGNRFAIHPMEGWDKAGTAQPMATRARTRFVDGGGSDVAARN